MTILGTGSSPPYDVDLISLSGVTLASTPLPAVGDGGAVAAGPGGAYFTEGDDLMLLHGGGAVTRLGAVALPPEGSGTTMNPPYQDVGELAISPNGGQWAYAVTVSNSADQLPGAQIWIGGPGLVPKLLVDSPETAGTLPSEFANGFTYQLLGWASRGVVVSEAPQGVGGAGVFLDYNVDTFFLNPTTGAQTPIENNPNCPLTSWTSSGAYACVTAGSGGTDISVRVAVRGGALRSIPFPADTLPGAAVLNATATELAYAQFNNSGSIDAQFQSAQTLLLNVAGGSPTRVGPAGVAPQAWLPDGQIVATDYSSASPGSPSLALVLVNPSTGVLAPLGPETTTGDTFVGVATQ